MRSLLCPQSVDDLTEKNFGTDGLLADELVPPMNSLCIFFLTKSKLILFPFLDCRTMLAKRSYGSQRYLKIFS